MIGRKRRAPSEPHHEPAPTRPPAPPPWRSPRTPPNIATLVYAVAQRLAPALNARGQAVGTPLWTECHELAGSCLGNGGDVEDAMSAVGRLLDSRLGPPEPTRLATIDPPEPQDTGVPEKPPSAAVSDISMTEGGEAGSGGAPVNTGATDPSPPDEDDIPL